jgi:tripartite-type tricarboxylate transporter receptor subunit TctC
MTCGSWFGRALAVLIAVMAPMALSAQTLPSGPVKFVVGFAGGGSTDAMARIIAEKLSERIGRNVIVENNAGASGRLAAEQVKKAAPNGSTVLVGNIGMIVLAPVTFKELSYDPLRDFAPVVRAADFQLVVAASQATGASDLPGLIRWLKENPDKANVGVPLQASLSHLTALRFVEAAGAPATMVVYRGSAMATQDMLGGRLAAGVAAVGDFVEQHRAGSMRIVGVSGVKRAPSLPDVPTFAEGGLKGLEGNGWNGFLLPAGTPAPIVELYNREIQAVVALPEVAQRLDQLGFVVPPPNTPADFAATIKSEMDAWRPLVKAAGLEQ